MPLTVWSLPSQSFDLPVSPELLSAAASPSVTDSDSDSDSHTCELANRSEIIAAAQAAAGHMAHMHEDPVAQAEILLNLGERFPDPDARREIVDLLYPPAAGLVAALKELEGDLGRPLARKALDMFPHIADQQVELDAHGHAARLAQAMKAGDVSQVLRSIDTILGARLSSKDKARHLASVLLEINERALQPQAFQALHTFYTRILWAGELPTNAKLQALGVFTQDAPTEPGAPGARGMQPLLAAAAMEAIAAYTAHPELRVPLLDVLVDKPLGVPLGLECLEGCDGRDLARGVRKFIRSLPPGPAWAVAEAPPAAAQRVTSR